MANSNSECLRPPAPPRIRNDLLMVGGDPQFNIVMVNKVEGKSKMIRGKCNSNTLTSRPYYLRSCKQHKRLLTNIESLPNDLVSKILVNLPAQDIFNRAMLVNRNWYRIVHSSAFIHAHLQNSPHGLLFERSGSGRTRNFVAIGRGGGIEVYKFPTVRYSHVRASCNGLILQEFMLNKRLFITNLITRQDFGIPPHPLESSRPLFHPVLGYLPSTMQYKVVVWYRVDRNPTEWIILTVGVDKSWREVGTRNISKSFFFSRALLTQGFMHWYSDTHVLTLNLETEIMTQTPIPPDVININYSFDAKYGRRSKCYLSTTGRSLSVLVWLSQLCWDIWEMRSETGEWTKVGHIDFKAQRRKLYRLRRGGENKAMVLIPVGWLEYREVLAFFIDSRSQTRVWIAYNVRTQEIDPFELEGSETGTNSVYPHTNSLEWITPCI